MEAVRKQRQPDGSYVDPGVNQSTAAKAFWTFSEL
jgi:hypothetical protein